MTPDEYFERRKQFGRTDAEGKKVYPVITPKDRILWVMWMLYFEEIGMDAASQWLEKEYGSFGSTYAVPTLDPVDFDPSTSVTMERAAAVQKRLDMPERKTEAEREAVVKAALKSFRASTLQQPVTREAAE